MGVGGATSVKTDDGSVSRTKRKITRALPVRVAFNSHMQSKLVLHVASHLETMSSSLRTSTLKDSNTKTLCDSKETTESSA